jgi:hypothetical protein
MLKILLTKTDDEMLSEGTGCPSPIPPIPSENGLNFQGDGDDDTDVDTWVYMALLGS